MPDSFGSRLRKAWNVFATKNQNGKNIEYGPAYSYRPDRIRFTRGNERTIVSAIYNRIAIDVASISIRHVILDENYKYKSDKNSGLNRCLTISTNIDQTPRAFMQDVVMSMFDEGAIAIVPIDTERDYFNGPIQDIYSMRVGQVVEWRPSSVKVRVYNELTGNKEDLVCPKDKVAIIENPFYAIMNQPNSMVHRLIRKLVLLDAVDEQTSSGKLDLIIQLPYVVKGDMRRQQAEQRRLDIEKQLTGSRYGIAYTDGTERITQLNRPIENNLMKQIEYLMNMVYSQLGITQSVMDGTADEQTMINYENRTVGTIVAAITEGMRRSFLTKTAISQGQSIMYFKDPFKLVPVTSIAEIADKFTRNEIMSSNEIRQVIGLKPSSDPKADELRNSNINAAKTDVQTPSTDEIKTTEEDKNQNEG